MNINQICDKSLPCTKSTYVQNLWWAFEGKEISIQIEIEVIYYVLAVCGALFNTYLIISPSVRHTTSLSYWWRLQGSQRNDSPASIIKFKLRYLALELFISLSSLFFYGLEQLICPFSFVPAKYQIISSLFLTVNRTGLQNNHGYGTVQAISTYVENRFINISKYAI